MNKEETKVEYGYDGSMHVFQGVDMPMLYCLLGCASKNRVKWFYEPLQSPLYYSFKLDLKPSETFIIGEMKALLKVYFDQQHLLG